METLNMLLNNFKISQRRLNDVKEATPKWKIGIKVAETAENAAIDAISNYLISRIIRIEQCVSAKARLTISLDEEDRNFEFEITENPHYRHGETEIFEWLLGGRSWMQIEVMHRTREKLGWDKYGG